MRYSSLTKSIIFSLLILVAFGPAAMAQDEWQLFPRPSFPHKVYAATIHDGELIVGGVFTSIHDVQANHVAKWDGTGWAPLGEGTPEAVATLATFDGVLYSGNALTFSDTTVGDGYVTRFDGTVWQRVATLVNPDSSSPVEAMVEFGDFLAVGGNFDEVEGIPAAGVAVYDGTSWSSLGEGVTGPGQAVTALCVWQGDLIAGGDFTVAGGGAADRIARWTGTEWQPVGTGDLRIPETLISYADDLWAGFGIGLGGYEVRRWDGLEWSDAGTGIDELFPNSVGNPRRAVLDFAEFDGQLYMGGRFGASPTTHGWLAGRWNGSSWEKFGKFIGYGPDSETSWSIEVLVPWNDRLVLGGFFPESAGSPIENIVAWTGVDFEKVATDELGLDGHARDFAIVPDGVVVAGRFDEAGAVETGPVARWDGANWQPLGATEADRIDGTVFSVEIDGADVLVGGEVTLPDRTTVSVARFDGASWTAIGDGGEPFAREITFFDGDLVAVMDYHVRRWNGSAWEILGEGMPTIVRPYVLAVYQEQLFAAGSHLGSTTKGSLAVFRLDDGQWTSIAPSGTYWEGTPSVMEVHDGELLVGGNMDGVGEVSSPGLIAWDGSRWSARTQSMDVWGNVFAIGATADGELVIGGSFLDLDGLGINKFAVEDPVTGWRGVEGSPAGPVYAVLADGADLWVGGGFTETADGFSRGVAIWHTGASVSIDQPEGQPGGPPTAPRRIAVDVIPNPFNPQTTFRFGLRDPGPVDIEVFDQVGRRVRTVLAGEWLDAGEHHIPWDGLDEGGSGVASGVYFVRIKAHGVYMGAKMTLVR